MVHYDIIEPAEPSAPTLFLSSGLGGAAGYWTPQIAALRQQYRIATYDHAGTGRSPASLPKNYTITDMAADVAQILDQTATPTCHFVGHALGGLVGLELARLAPERLASLTVVNGWAKPDAHTLRCFEARLALLQHVGIAAYIRAQPIFLYPAAWLAANEAAMTAEDAHGIASFQGVPSLLSRLAALQTFDATAHLAHIAVPTLLIATADDVLVPATRSEHLAAHIPGAKLAMLDRGGHAINVTDPAAFNTTLLTFLRSLPSSSPSPVLNGRGPG